MLAAGLALIMVLGMTACGGGEEALSTDQTTAGTTVPTTTAPPRYLNLLTGEMDLETPNNRPVAFMIGNVSYTKNYLQQKNIDKADMYVEAETEGGIPRIMMVFSSIDKVPNAVGPVRSARTHFVKMVKSLDAMYCHVGGSTLGSKMIKDKKITDLNSLTTVSQELKAANGAIEHTKVFLRSSIDNAIAKRGIAKTTTKKSPYIFGNKAGTGLGNKVQVNISGGWRISFEYDANTKLYTKHRKEFGTPAHTSYDGDPITASNIIIMYANRFDEDAKHISFELAAGEGTLVSGGSSRDIKWTRTDDALKFTETDGTPLTVAKGKTYICITSKGLKGKTVLQ